MIQSLLLPTLMHTDFFPLELCAGELHISCPFTPKYISVYFLMIGAFFI